VQHPFSVYDDTRRAWATATVAFLSSDLSCTEHADQQAEADRHIHATAHTQK
jgi:hypothetical protein